jgi:hypothetical protein
VKGRIAQWSLDSWQSWPPLLRSQRGRA